MKAYHLLHSHNQLALAEAELREADVLVVNPAFDVGAVNSATKASAIVLPSFNAAKLYLGGQDNDWWNQFRGKVGTLVDWPEEIVDPGDKTPHKLVRPTVSNAWAIAEAIDATCSHWVRGGRKQVYIDDSPRVKPSRIIALESAQLAREGWDRGKAFVFAHASWRAYLEVLFGRLRASGWTIWSNCASQPLDDEVVVCTEYSHTSDAHVVKKAIDRWGRTVLWWHPKQLELEGIIVVGLKLPEVQP